ncbi:antitoxin MazE5 [Flexivirga alba]|uniref:Antitoxin MazE5 n=1 Tax=Flexivirga alba TaxID=702742 RepID=A0ABW2AF15_9MICO
MARLWISTTVDADLLEGARNVTGSRDAALLDEALAALLARHRSAELDANYGTYGEHPLTKPDEWGDPDSRDAAW